MSQTTPLPKRGAVQVWSAGKEILLRDPRTIGDSLIGYQLPPDTARTAIPIATIDSIRVETTDMGKVLIVGTGIGLALLLAWGSGFGGME